jgi:hypothetical protein
MRRGQLMGKLNKVLYTFGKLGYMVKIDLIFTYWSSFYGSVLWNLDYAEIKRLIIAWSTALRRVFYLADNLHSSLLALLHCIQISLRSMPP